MQKSEKWAKLPLPFFVHMCYNKENPKLEVKVYAKNQ